MRLRYDGCCDAPFTSARHAMTPDARYYYERCSPVHADDDERDEARRRALR